MEDKQYKAIFYAILAAVIIICLTISCKLYFTNKDLESQLNQLEKKYQELIVQNGYDDYAQVRLTRLSLIEENFQWMRNIEEADKITFENYDGKTIDIKEDAPINKFILQGLGFNSIVAPDNIINDKLHNDSRFYYTLRYYIEDTVHVVIIYDNGTIKYKDVYYESPMLLSAAQSLMPIFDNASNDEHNNALSTMLYSSLATFSEYKISDTENSIYEQSLIELWNNAIKLRASAYYIKENMIKVNKTDKSINIDRVLKSSGYDAGNQVDMYIFMTNEGNISYVKLVYNSIEEIYKIKSTANQNAKSLPLYNIWTAD